ncbi:MAG: hypothetical protein PVJ02_10900 [Gemmatimonadota bacterium]
MDSKRVAALIALSLTGAIATVAANPAPHTTARSCATVLQSQVCTWAVMDGDRPVELDATVPMALVQAVPADAEMVWPPKELASVPLPAEAKKALGIDHLGINWEAHGHPPAHFMEPHFDFHFYNITQSQVGAIDCSDDAKPGVLPAGYALPDVDVPGLGTLVGLCVPLMGMHAMEESETRDPAPFQASLMLGYYAGKPIFFEPMVSRARLLQGADFELDVPAVDDLPAGVRYPTTMRAVYDPAQKEYRLVLTGF